MFNPPNPPSIPPNPPSESQTVCYWILEPFDFFFINYFIAIAAWYIAARAVNHLCPPRTNRGRTNQGDEIVVRAINVEPLRSSRGNETN